MRFGTFTVNAAHPCKIVNQCDSARPACWRALALSRAKGCPAGERHEPSLALAAGAWHTRLACVNASVSGRKTSKPSYLEVIFEQRRDYRAALLRVVLYLVSKVFQLAVKLRRFLYNVRILRDSTLGVQVIAIGNLTWAARARRRWWKNSRANCRTRAGRWPSCRAATAPSRRRLGKRLMNKILFREDSTPPRVVSDGKSLLLDSETAGDEPYMLASNLKDVVVLVDKDRVKSGRYAIEKFGCDTLLLDDGFQYWKLRGRRQDIVLVDRQQPFGNERLHAARARCASRRRTWRARTRSSSPRATGTRRNCAGGSPSYNPTAGIIECIHHPLYFEDVFTGEQHGLELIKGRKVASLSGIAQPESFEQSLPALGATLVYSKRFADHHRFTQQEILNAINRGKKRQAECIVTTQKDAVRFPKIDRRDLPIYFMRVEIKILSGREGLSGLRPQNLLPLSDGPLLYHHCPGADRRAAGAAADVGGAVRAGGRRAGVLAGRAASARGASGT